MTLPFLSFLNRAGLELDEAQAIDFLTTPLQNIKPWINLQAQFRSAGLKKVAKAESAALLITECFKMNEVLDDDEKLLLLKGAVAVYAFAHQDNLTVKFETYKISSELIDQHKDMLNSQYLKSKELSENRGFFEKLLN
tara:strand:+ start:359 stop:772 length:414 start_codon:yes stop_codon:yes gene_type:complete